MKEAVFKMKKIETLSTLKSRFRINALSVALLFMILITGALNEGAFAEDNKAPDFRLDTIDGKQVSLNSFKGKPVLLWFMALSCPSCAAQADIVKQIKAEYGGKIDILVIDMLGDTKADLQNFISNKGSPDWKTAIDTDRVSIKYGITVVDSTVILDGNGNIAYKNLGPASFQSVKDAVSKSLSIPLVQ